MSCPGELVTGYVDEALDGEARAAVEQHLASCAACQEQVAAERALRASLRALPTPEPPPRLAIGLRAKLVHPPRRHAHWHWVLPLAAALAVVIFFGRGAPQIIEFQLALDHIHCFGRESLPAEVWSGDPAVVGAWFAERQAALPLVPAGVDGLELAGGRFCGLFDRKVVHLYYVGGSRHASLYVVPEPAHFSEQRSASRRGQAVRLLRVGGATVGLVGEHPEDVEALQKALVVSYARVSLRPF